MPIQSPQEFVSLKLRHIEDAENQALQAIDQISQEVRNDQLRQLLDRRRDEGRQVLEGIRQSMQKMGGGRHDGADLGDGQNRAARGIIEEGQMLMREVQDPELKQAIAIGSVQSLEHYCIATWGTVKAIAREMGEQDLVRVMERALDSGKRLDHELTQLAESRVNPQALGEERSFASSGEDQQSMGRQDVEGSQRPQTGSAQQMGSQDGGL